MADLEKNIQRKNKASEQVVRNQEREVRKAASAEKRKEFAEKFQSKIDKVKGKIHDFKERADFQAAARDAYQTFLKMYDESKIGTVEFAEQDGVTFTVAHTENGPIIEIVRPSRSKEGGSFSWSRAASDAYDTSVTYEGFYPVKTEKGAVEYRYGKLTQKTFYGIGDYGPHGDFSDDGTKVLEGAMLDGRKFTQVSRKQEMHWRYNNYDNSAEVVAYEALKSDFAKAKEKAASANKQNGVEQGEQEQVGPTN